MQTDQEILSVAFKTRDFYKIPRPLLLKTLANSMRRSGRLYLDLFCANPSHPIFANEPEEILAPLRVERIRRIATEAEKYKEVKKVVCKNAFSALCALARPNNEACPHLFKHEHNEFCDCQPKMKCRRCE
jgi:hypothetical protein